MSQEQHDQKEKTIEMCGAYGFYRIPLSKYNEIVNEQNPAAPGYFPTLGEALVDADKRLIAETEKKIQHSRNSRRRTRTLKELFFGDE